MGELSGSTDGFAAGPQAKTNQDSAVTAKQDGPDGTQGVKTDVDGVFADGEKSGVPVFDVSQKEFYDNMKADRRRLRFKAGTPAATYHQKSNYRRPFYIRNKDDGYMRMYK
jgi:hypothetical protein